MDASLEHDVFEGRYRRTGTPINLGSKVTGRVLGDARETLT